MTILLLENIMNNFIQKISQKIIEIRYNVNITKPITNINKLDDKKDLMIISENGKKLLEKEGGIINLKQSIKHKKYKISDKMIDEITESIASMLTNN